MLLPPPPSLDSCYILCLDGFPVNSSPVHLTDIWWLILYPVLAPILEHLPNPWKDPWLASAQLWNIWRLGHKPFAEAGHDTVVLLTPQGNLLWACDPHLTLHPRSQVAVDMVKFYDIYGPTVGSVEGDELKQHSRVIVTGFDPATTEAVWTESMKQAGTMVQQWSEDSGIVPVTRTWTNRLALHVISTVFFRKSLTWIDRVQGVEPTPPGHKLRYDQALTTVLQPLGTLHITPRALLPHLRFKAVREAHLAYTEWTAYTSSTRGRWPEPTTSKTRSTRASSIRPPNTSPPSPFPKPLTPFLRIHRPLQRLRHPLETRYIPLPQASILGNIFFTLLAGHETAGNTMAFALLLLAVHPAYQWRIQSDLDAHLASRPRAAWTVETEYRALQNSWLGAVLTETLQLCCAVQFVPRQIIAGVDVVDSKGVPHALPRGTLCLMDFAAAFRNPNTWAAGHAEGAGGGGRGQEEKEEEVHGSPALDFEPERWLGGAPAPRTEDGSAPLLFPFGQGPHVCPGQLFALTEMTAVLAAILAEHSVELRVEESTLEECGGDVGEAARRTRRSALRTLVDDIEPNVTVQLTEPLPIRIRRRFGESLLS